MIVLHRSECFTAYAPDTPRAGRKATRRARCSGLAPALSRLRGTYALARSGGGLAPAESDPEDVAAHCFRSMACRVALCGLSVNPGVIGDAGVAAKRYAARKSGRSSMRGIGLRRGTTRYAPGSPLPSASSVRWPFRSTPGPSRCAPIGEQRSGATTASKYGKRYATGLWPKRSTGGVVRENRRGKNACLVEGRAVA